MTLSIIIPAFNEEKNIESAVKNAISAAEGKFSDFEILLFNDCSQDNTGVIIDKLKKEDSRIRVIHNRKNEGFANSYKKGVELAEKDFVAMVPGDDEISAESVSEIFGLVGKADIIIPYTVNRQIRSFSRQLISSFFTALINFLFGLKLKYFNGPVVHRRELIQSIKIKSSSFAFQAEALVQLIKMGHSFIEVGMYIKNREYGKSKALRLNNLLGVLKTVFELFQKVYFSKKN